MSRTEPPIRIVCGGTPDGPGHAAILAAVTQVLHAHDDPPAPASSWTRAARLEGVGRTTIRTRSGLPRG